MNKYTILLLLLFGSVFCSSPVISAEKINTGTITGRITLKDGTPLSGGKVLFFKEGLALPPSQSKYWRTPDEITMIDDKGTFTADLKEGDYYISAMKKLSKDLIGPPVDGDYVYPERRKDLKSDQQLYFVNKGKVTNIGTIAEAVPFRKKTAILPEGITAIQGIILDAEEKPVLGAIAMAFISSSVTGKPFYVSERTGKDGKYLLRVGEGGTYYIKIRTTLKGKHPEPGEIIGVYGKNMPEPVTVLTGKITTGIDVKGKIFDMDERRKPSGKTPLFQNNTLLKQTGITTPINISRKNP